MAFFGKAAAARGRNGGGGKTFNNADGPGGSTIDYGSARGKRQDQRYKEAREKYGSSNWYGRAGDANPMPNAGGPSARGKVTPFFTPDAGDPRNDGYYVAENHSMDDSIAAAKARNREAYNADPAFAAAKGAGDLKAQIAAMAAARAGAQRQRFVDQGGQGSTWDNRFDESNAWPVPGVSKSGAGQSSGGGASTGSLEVQPQKTDAQRWVESELNMSPPPWLAQLLGKPPTGMLGAVGTSKPASIAKPAAPEKSAPRGIRRGGGRVDYK